MVGTRYRNVFRTPPHPQPGGYFTMWVHLTFYLMINIIPIITYREYPPASPKLSSHRELVSVFSDVLFNIYVLLCRESKKTIRNTTQYLSKRTMPQRTGLPRSCLKSDVLLWTAFSCTKRDGKQPCGRCGKQLKKVSV